MWMTASPVLNVVTELVIVMKPELVAKKMGDGKKTRDGIVARVLNQRGDLQSLLKGEMFDDDGGFSLIIAADDSPSRRVVSEMVRVVCARHDDMFVVVDPFRPFAVVAEFKALGF